MTNQQQDDDAQVGERIRAATKRVSTVALLRNVGAYTDAALAEPIILTKNGRDRLVLMSIEQYETLQDAYDALQGNSGLKAPAGA
jgi:prevent-host-death family protein